MLVPDPPGLDVTAHNFVGGSSSSTHEGDFPRDAGEDFETHNSVGDHTHVVPQFPSIGPIYIMYFLGAHGE